MPRMLQFWICTQWTLKNGKKVLRCKNNRRREIIFQQIFSHDISQAFLMKDHSRNKKKFGYSYVVWYLITCLLVFTKKVI